MPDKISTEKRSWNMSRIKSNNTSVEKKVRKYLRENKIYLRKNRKLAGKPDFASVKYKIALFVNGCFWHQHGCKRSTTPKSNQDYWQKKLTRNVERDAQNAVILQEAGYRVFTIWECEINSDVATALFSFINDYKEMTSK